MFLTSLGDELKQKKIAIAVFSEKKKKWIVDYQGDLSLVPNSILKLVTAASSLKFLGEDFRFKTSIVAMGNQSQGELFGDLVIVGSGDPTLGSHREGGLPVFIDKCTLALKKKGIQSIQGKIKINQKCFDEVVRPASWLEEDIANYYGTGVYGFNIHENFYNLTFKLGSYIGEKTVVEKIEPEVPYLDIDNRVLSYKKGSCDRTVIFQGKGGANVYVEGTLPLDAEMYTIKGAIPNPSEFARYHLERSFKESEVEVKNFTLGSSDKEEVIGEIYSKPLSEIVFTMNKFSINLYAEALLKTINQGSYDQSIKKVDEYLSQLDVKGIKMIDGSGLSRQNQVTAKGMASFLYKIREELYFPCFFKSLSTSFPEKEFQGRLFSKTGYSSQGRSLAGILITKTGERLFFCYIENELDQRLSPILREKIKALFNILISS